MDFSGLLRALLKIPNLWLTQKWKVGYESLQQEI